MKPIDACDRCVAKRANDEQCTRRKKKGCDYCGTHSKNSPNGEVEVVSGLRKKEVWAEEVMGIVRYVDAEGNSYNVEDVLSEKENPRPA
jgi:hypothetical protein